MNIQGTFYPLTWSSLVELSERHEEGEISLEELRGFAKAFVKR